MRSTGFELFMDKLKLVIYSKDNPLISDHPSILSEKGQFQLLYEELHSVIHTLHSIHDQHHDLQQVKDLKRRLKDAAEDAHDAIDLFVYHINLGNQVPLNLDDDMSSIKSIREELMNIINNDMFKMDSSPRTDCENTQPPPATVIGTKKTTQDMVLGFDRHSELIGLNLLEGPNRLDVVSIVGMGGLGKTTLAIKVFNHPFIVQHFHIRGWVTVTQTYEKKDLLLQILNSIGNTSLIRHDYSKLRKALHQKLIYNKYLIVIDDIWSPDAWDVLKLFFPNENNRSRILLTSRLKEVALHANPHPHAFIHQLEYLTEDESWELLCRKVFGGSIACPEWLVESGMKIAKNCHGLPLTLVVIAGVLAKEPLRKDSWERIGRKVSSYIVDNEPESIEKLAWSFDHLPGRLRDCYLYLGGFPEDHKFQVQLLMWLWMAEGFIQEDGIHSLEEIAERHLIELVDRNLVLVADRKPHGDIKTIYVHDILRELCIKIATEENLYLKAYLKAQDTTPLIETYNQCRIFMDADINNIMNAPRIRSLLCFHSLQHTREVISEWPCFWKLLMVLDLGCIHLDYFLEEMSRLVHLRYLHIWLVRVEKLPTSLCKLWSLQTLIIRCTGFAYLELPESISNLVNLRHLKSREIGRYFRLSKIEKPMNLQMISKVRLGDRNLCWVNCFPSVKKLSCIIAREKHYDLESLTSLEHMKLSGRYLDMRRAQDFIRFPLSLKSLVLRSSYLCWSDMPIIQSLPNLEVLKLYSHSFTGPQWDVGEKKFRKLKILKMFNLDLKEWEASNLNFPCLKQLTVQWCRNLEEVPLEFGNIQTLELINISYCKESVEKSINSIEEEQRAQGNIELIVVKK